MISKVMTASAAALCTLAFVSFAAPAAQAGEFCATNSSGMRGCGFATLEQCKQSMSGVNGTCDRDPYYKNPKDALAQVPKHSNAARQPVQH